MSDDRRSPDTVSQSVTAMLASLPSSVATSPTALATLELARSIDQGPDTYRFQAALVRELRESVAELRAAAEALGDTEDDVDDLAARRVARRAEADAV